MYTYTPTYTVYAGSLHKFCARRAESYLPRTVSLPLTEETFNWWDTATNTVHPLKGSYKLLYGGSSDDRALQTMMYEF